MFKDMTDYQEEHSGHVYCVKVGERVIATGLTYPDALRLAQKTKGSRTAVAT